jgi:Flp pilus assembly protein TadD
LETYPLDAQLLCALGGYLERNGRTDLATRSYETAYRFGQVTPETWHLQEIAPFVAARYSQALQLRGQDELAYQVLTETLERDPGSLQLHRQVLELHLKHGRTEDALAQLEKWPVQPRAMEPLRKAVRGASFAAQKDWPAARSHLQAAFTAGCRDVVCLRWLSRTLLSLGETGEAETVLRAWSEVTPDDVELQHYSAEFEKAHGTPTLAPPTVAQSDADPQKAEPAVAPSPNSRIDKGEPSTDRPRRPVSAPVQTQFFVSRDHAF